MNDKTAFDRWSSEASQGRRGLMCCLSIDLIGSTSAGKEMPRSVLDRFNEAVIRQIQPHLRALGLQGEDIKFVGDGWLLWVDATDTLKVRAACCLARIMAVKFQAEMAQATGIAVDKIPPLRQTLCCGEDLPVYLDRLRREWLGDSARRAVRASGWCAPNEVLIDEPVRYIVFRDFVVTDADLANRPLERRPKREEEKIPLHVLWNLRDGAVNAPGSPEVYTAFERLIAQ
jgi:hypothetical protein